MTPTLLENATRLRREGKIAEAAAVYGEVLRQNPANFDALQALGIICYQAGQIEHAERLIAQAAGIRPGAPDLAYNHACLLQKLNRLEDALARFDQALSLKPDYLEALVNRGAVLGALKRHEEALLNADRVIALRPDFAEGWANRAASLQLLGRLEAAFESYNRVVVLNARHPTAWKNRGIVLRQLARLDDSLRSFEKACEIAPKDADAHGRYADLLTALSRFQEAADEYKHYLTLSPNDGAGWHARGSVLQVMHRREESLACFDRALQLDPANDAIRTSRANILFELERFEEAAREYEVLLAAVSPPAWLHGYLTLCHLHCCDWRRLDVERTQIAQSVHRGEFVVDPVGHACICDSPADQFQCAKIWARDRCPPAEPLWKGERYRHDRIRIAYLSADFRAHATAFLMAGVFEHHDKSRFATTAISWSLNDHSPMRKRLSDAFDQFVEVSDRTDRGIAQLLREHEIDIAIDLKGYTNESRPAIFAHRGAPVQAQYLAYPGTMAVDFIDYVIADQIVIPEQDQQLYSEKIAWLPDSYQANDNRRDIPAHPPSRGQAGLPDGFVFCCFNSNHKILPETFATWMRLLNAVPGSVLWLLKDNETGVRNLRDTAQAHGVRPDRLVFAPRTDPLSHLARQALADLFLDTVPYNAHTTASDALWSGLPLLTVSGSTFASRVGASIVTAAGLPELVTNSLAQYEALALQLVRDPARLKAIRDRLEANRGSCALFDTAGFTRSLEAAYTLLWERSQRGMAPESFAVRSGTQ